MKTNRDKTKIVHFRKKSVSRSKHEFNLDGNNIEIVDKYKYLGIYFDEFLDFKCTASMFAGTGGRAQGSIICKIKSLKNVGFETYTKLYHSRVVPVMDYSSGGPIIPYTPLNIANIHNIDLIPAIPINIF